MILCSALPKIFLSERVPLWACGYWVNNRIMLNESTLCIIWLKALYITTFQNSIDVRVV